MTQAVVDYTDLEKSLEAFLKGRFGAVEILSVAVDEDCDPDRDRVLEITINFKGTPKEIAQNEPAGFLRSLQEQLRRLRENAYPVVHFRPFAA